jgi:sugar phosphate isomerase/epimerase
VRLAKHPNLHLTYCTNIHPADGWDAVFASVARYGPPLKARFSPDAPFGLGLRLSARDASELRTGSRLRSFQDFLREQGLYVAIINGFPYGPFHGTPVKASVYAPDWRHDERVDYTLDLIEIVRATMPAGVDGGVSTAPLSYKPWLAAAEAGAWDAIVRNVVRVAERLVRLRQEDGTRIHLDIEPEPDCVLENTAETLDFFARRLLPIGTPMLARALQTSESAAREHLLEHVRICFDCCHFAVEFEDAPTALERIAAAGIKIGRVQLSSALDVPLPRDADSAGRLVERLRAFADATYLHQVVERRGGELRHYLDLPDALEQPPEAAASHWRIHFHVPLFASEYGALGSTQSYVAEVLRHMLRTGATTHLEIETYTWDVLPAGLKLDLLDSIAREYNWVLRTAGEQAADR